MSTQKLPATTPQRRPGGCTGRGFVPGQSGNPAGGTSRNRALVRALAKALKPEMLLQLRNIAQDTDAPAPARVFASAVVVEASR